MEQTDSMMKYFGPVIPLICWLGMNNCVNDMAMKKQDEIISRIKQSKIELVVEGAEFSKDSAVKGVRFYDGETTKTYSLEQVRKGINPWEYTKK